MRTLSILAGQIALSAALGTSVLAQPKEVVVATTGGTYDRALKEIWFEPFTKATGIGVATVVATDSEQRTRAQAMANAGKVTWDIINNVDIIAESAQNRSFSRDLTSFCKSFEARKDLAEKTCGPAGVKISFNATLMAFNTERFKDGPPETGPISGTSRAFPAPGRYRVSMTPGVSSPRRCWPTASRPTSCSRSMWTEL